MFKIISKSSEETQKIGERLARICSGGEIIGLVGDLGGGKTTFVQGMAKGLGIKRQITSPSFVLLKKYPISNLKSQVSNLYHIDLYRIDTPNDVYSFGFEEVLEDKKGICVIEWAEKVMGLLPKERLIIEFDFISENERKLIFKPEGKRYKELVDKVLSL